MAPSELLHRIRRIGRHLSALTRVARRLGFGPTDRVKILFGGLWLLITDAGKSRLRFSARVARFGRHTRFRFEDFGDILVFDEVFLRSPLAELERGEPGDETGSGPLTILDLGAHIGVAALYFRLRWPRAAVHCFEPDPENVRRLHGLAGETGGLHVHQMALWFEPATIAFYVDPHRGSSSSMSRRGAHQQRVEVPAVTLARALELAGGGPVDLVKLDIEGAEQKVLEAADAQDLFNVRALVGEVHGDLCDGQAVLSALNAWFTRLETAPMVENDRRFYVTAW